MFVIFVIISSITKIDTKAEGKEDTEKEEKLEWFEGGNTKEKEMEID